MTADLNETRNDAVRDFVARQIRERYEGHRSAYAKAAKLSPSIITELLKGGRGAGLRVVDRIAAEAGVSPEVVLGRATVSEVADDVGGTAWGACDGWVESEAEIRRTEPQWPAWSYTRAKRIRGIRPPLPITPAVVRQALTLVFATTPADELAELEAARQDAELERMKRVAETRASRHKK